MSHCGVGALFWHASIFNIFIYQLVLVNYSYLFISVSDS